MRSVSKFGGSSIQDAKAMKDCADIVKNHPHTAITVISATQNTTNQLEEIESLARMSQKQKAFDLLHKIHSRHLNMALHLAGDDILKKKLDGIITEGKFLIGELSKERDSIMMDCLYGLGERLACELFHFTLNKTLSDKQIKLVDAYELIITDNRHGAANPDLAIIDTTVKKKLGHLISQNILVLTQGFIGATSNGTPTTLGREGSDLSGALLARAIKADRYYIWTDVNGIYRADPKIFPDAPRYKEMSYEQARNLAKKGAKVLFEKTLDPLENSNLSIFVKNSRHPNKEGTWIHPNCSTMA